MPLWVDSWHYDDYWYLPASVAVVADPSGLAWLEKGLDLTLADHLCYLIAAVARPSVLRHFDRDCVDPQARVDGRC